MASAPVRACEVLLFDLGGVIVELSGVPQWVARGGSRESERLVWERWLRSPTVREFECGRWDSTRARRAGLRAVRVSGVDGVERYLRRSGLLTDDG